MGSKHEQQAAKHVWFAIIIFKFSFLWVNFANASWQTDPCGLSGFPEFSPFVQSKIDEGFEVLSNQTEIVDGDSVRYHFYITKKNERIYIDSMNIDFSELTEKSHLIDHYHLPVQTDATISFFESSRDTYYDGEEIVRCVNQNNLAVFNSLSLAGDKTEYDSTEGIFAPVGQDVDYSNGKNKLEKITFYEFDNEGETKKSTKTDLDLNLKGVTYVQKINRNIAFADSITLGWEVWEIPQGQNAPARQKHGWASWLRVDLDTSGLLTNRYQMGKNWGGFQGETPIPVFEDQTDLKMMLRENVMDQMLFGPLSARFNTRSKTYSDVEVYTDTNYEKEALYSQAKSKNQINGRKFQVEYFNNSEVSSIRDLSTNEIRSMYFTPTPGQLPGSTAIRTARWGYTLETTNGLSKYLRRYNASTLADVQTDKYGRLITVPISSNAEFTTPTLTRGVKLAWGQKYNQWIPVVRQIKRDSDWWYHSVSCSRFNTTANLLRTTEVEQLPSLGLPNNILLDASCTFGGTPGGFSGSIGE